MSATTYGRRGAADAVPSGRGRRRPHRAPSPSYALLLAGGIALAPIPALPAETAAQGEGGEAAANRRVTGQVHRTIRRAGAGPLPRAVHGVRLGTSTAGARGPGFRSGSPAAPRTGAFGAPARPRGGLGGTGRGVGILRGLPRGLVHGPLVAGPGGTVGLLRGVAAGPPWLLAAAAAAGIAERGRPAEGAYYVPPPPEAGPPLPPAKPAPTGPCALVTLRLAAGPDRSLRVAAGGLGAETPEEAGRILERRAARGEPIVLRGLRGPGLIVPGGLVRAVAVSSCPEERGGGP